MATPLSELGPVLHAIVVKILYEMNEVAMVCKFNEEIAHYG